MVAMREIGALSRRIARRFRPRRIILFGSYARGQATPDSDVDLLVRTPQEIRRRLAMGDTFLRDVLENGKVPYEADDA